MTKFDNNENKIDKKKKEMVGLLHLNKKKKKETIQVILLLSKFSKDQGRFLAKNILNLTNVIGYITVLIR